MKTYKLWMHLEEYDDETEESTDLGWPDSLGSFETEAEAHAAAWPIVEAYGTDPDGSDHQPHLAEPEARA